LPSWRGQGSLYLYLFSRIHFSVGYAVAQLVEALRYKPEVAGSIPHGVIGIFH
jgi:hypothetical protein